MTRFELVTSSLPRKRSTPELHRQFIYDCRFLIHDLHSYIVTRKFLSERPGSNRRHSAWKADALPTELLSHYFSDSFRIFGFQYVMNFTERSRSKRDDIQLGRLTLYQLSYSRNSSKSSKYKIPNPNYLRKEQLKT